VTAPEEFDPFEVQAEEALRFAISEAEQGRMDSLAMALRDPRPMPDRLRRWLADLFDPEGDSEFVARLKRRNAGAPSRPSRRVVRAAYHVVVNIGPDTKLEALLDEAIGKHSASKHRISRSQLIAHLGAHWPDLFPAARMARAARRQKFE
jgi:hypothetical protein